MITIPGTRRIENLKQNIASEKVSLSKEDLQSIEEIMPLGSASGTRYPESFMSSLNK
jgi:aryl-alcohol dehydrogenase-like predicted oxidoreductase